MKIKDLPIAIVGAGPAGSSLAYLLARAGREVLLFSSPAAGPKHCAGGVPARSFDEFPWLKSLRAPFRRINRISLFSPGGALCDLRLRRAVKIYVRSAFDERLRELASGAGARVIPRRVRFFIMEGRAWCLNAGDAEYRASFLVGAGGAGCIVRRRLFGRFRPEELSLCAGYYLKDLREERISVGFLRRKAAYAWSFPRPDAASTGIGAPLAGSSRRVLLSELRRWLALVYPEGSFDFSRPYSAIVPTASPRAGIPAGEGWACVGDAACVAEPVTREGIYHSLVSSSLLAEALFEGRPESYAPRLREVRQNSLRAAYRLRRYFFTPFFTERAIRAAARSAPARRALERFFSGSLQYGDVLPAHFLGHAARGR